MGRVQFRGPHALEPPPCQKEPSVSGMVHHPPSFARDSLATSLGSDAGDTLLTVTPHTSWTSTAHISDKKVLDSPSLDSSLENVTFTCGALASPGTVRGAYEATSQMEGSGDQYSKLRSKNLGPKALALQVVNSSSTPTSSIPPTPPQHHQDCLSTRYGIKKKKKARI